MAAFNWKDEVLQWVRPTVVYIIGILLYNCFIVGDLVGIPGKFGSVETNSKYEIMCNFELKNKGVLPIKSEKIQLSIPKAATVSNIDIPIQYKYLYKIIDGGKDHNFIIFLIEGMKGMKTLEGSVSFSQNKKWEKDYINPLSFSE